jgi:hypothetical protein
MNSLSRRSSVLLVIGLGLAPAVTFAQNIASNFGASGQNRERLTLLPGPNLLSPGRGIAVPQVDGAGTILPGNTTERSPAIRFLPGRIHARPAQGTLSLVSERQAGAKPLSFDSMLLPAGSPARPLGSALDPGELRFEAKLPPVPPPSLRRK